MRKATSFNRRAPCPFHKPLWRSRVHTASNRQLEAEHLHTMASFRAKRHVTHLDVVAACMRLTTSVQAAHAGTMASTKPSTGGQRCVVGSGVGTWPRRTGYLSTHAHTPPTQSLHYTPISTTCMRSHCCNTRTSCGASRSHTRHPEL